MTGYATKERAGKVSRQDRGIRRAMLRRADEVNVFTGFDSGFVAVTKKEARKLRNGPAKHVVRQAGMQRVSAH